MQSGLLSLLRAVLAQPEAQGNVGVGWGVVAVGVDAPAQKLPPNGIALLPEALNGHVVLGANPAIAIAVEEHFAGHVRPVRAGRMPQPSVEEDRRARFGQHRRRALRLADTVR